MISLMMKSTKFAFGQVMLSCDSEVLPCGRVANLTSLWQKQKLHKTGCIFPVT